MLLICSTKINTETMFIDQIGRIVAYSQHENFEHPIEVQLLMNDLVYLIRIYSKTRDIDKLVEYLKPFYLKLRYDILKQNESNPYVLKEIHEGTKNGVIELINEDSEAGYTMAAFMEVYSVMLGEIIEKFDLEKIIVEEDRKDLFKSFEAYLLHPEPRVQYVKHWMDASINFEIAMLIANVFVLNDLEELSKAKQQELFTYTKHWLIRYSAYAIFIGYWTPNKDWIRETTIRNSIKLLAARLEHDHYPETSGTRCTINELKKHLGVA